jgi:Secretion system C-terminal sorting domain
MKKIYSLLLLVVTSVSFGQTFYSENMGIPTANTGIAAYATGTAPATFQNGAPIEYTGTSDVRASLPSSGYTGVSGGGNVFINAVDEFFQIDNLNTSAYNTADLQLSFGVNTPTAVTNVLTVEVSTNNGTSWTPITYTPSGTGWTLATIAGGVIPSAADLAIRFSSATTLQYRLDDIKLSSVSASCTLVLGAPTTACDASTAAADTYTVTIPYTGAGNGTYTITPNQGTVGGDNPTTTAAGNITVSGVTEGVAFSATIVGVTCNFTVTAASPECDPINTLPYVESFNYAEAANLGASPKWTNVNSGDNIITTGDGSLSYPGFTTSGNRVLLGADGIDCFSPITSNASGTIYYSYLLNVNSMAGVTNADGGYISGFGNGTTTLGATLWTKRVDDTNFNIGLEVRTANAANTTYTSASYATGTTYFIVVGYTFGDPATASDDTVNLWVNPVVNAAQTAATLTDSHTGTDLTAIDAFFLRQDSTTETPSLLIDELRIGTTWADVTNGTLSVSQNEIAGLNVYPNPTTGIFYVETALNAVKNITVYDILGKQVLSTTTSSNEINAANLNSGLYIVKITEEGKTATKKLIIE